MIPAVTKAFVIDVLERAGKTFLQAGLAATTAAYSASGLSAAHATDWSTLEKVLGSGAVGGGAAVLSLLMSVISGYRTGTASASKTVAATTPSAGAHAMELVPVSTVPYQASPITPPLT